MSNENEAVETPIHEAPQPFTAGPFAPPTMGRIVRFVHPRSEALANGEPWHPTSPAIILFDGVCNLCNASVQWVLLRDHAGIFRFAALQSEVGQTLDFDYIMQEVVTTIDVVVFFEKTYLKELYFDPVKKLQLLRGRAS